MYKIKKLSSKRQITLNKADLDFLGIIAGDRVIVIEKKEGLLIKPVKRSIVEEVSGSLSSYIPASKKGIKFSKVMEVTKKETSKKLAKK